MPSWTIEAGNELQLDELDGVQEVSIRLVGGEITLSGAEEPPRLEVSRVEDSPVEVRFEGGVLEVWHRESHGSGRRGFFGLLSGGRAPRASVALTVPPSTRAKVASVSADAVVTGLSEPATVKSVSGDLTLNEMRERVEAKTVSGDVEARGLAGDLRFGSVTGDLTVVNGSCKWLSAKTVSGDVVLDLDLVVGGSYSVATVSGDVAVRVPSEPSLEIDATSLSGDLDTPWDLRWDDPRGGRRDAGHTVGNGDARLSVKTLSGDLRIARRREAAA